MSGPGAAYDRIGTLYRRHRRPDPRIADQIAAALGEAHRVVNVGAGTGSYEPAHAEVVAVDPSPVMLAQRPAGSAPAVLGRAEALPFADQAFDAALAVITVHHWSDVRRGMRELARVAPRVVVLGFDPAVHFSYWLFDYLPDVLELESARIPTMEELAGEIGGGRIDPVPVPADCVDGFNWAYWRRPEAYFDPEVRACISALALLPEAVVAAGLERLRFDLDSGRWNERYGFLLERSSVDGGFRLLVSG